ncbi:MAG: ABC transporter permease [Chloroflexi bacterium]|nr:ABC transporter permease [Chloroflexota bacterium]
MSQLLKMAFRDLGRNKRRSILSALAVSMGAALLLLFASVLRGEIQSAIQPTIQLQTGHLQVRAVSYNENKISLKWEDLVANPDQVIAQIQSLPQVAVATPRLVASGIVTAGEDSRGVQVIGIDPASEANQVFRQGLIAGQFITPDDRDGIVVGKPLADKFDIQVGEKVNLLVNTSNGNVDEQLFTVKGIYSTNTTTYDENTVFMPLAKAQTITGTENHASTIFILLKDQAQAEAVATALQSPDYQVLTWQKMTEVISQTEDLANSFMYIFYLIILGITATVVTNTLVMSVFERTREIGILLAIGMKGYRIMAQFLTEAAVLATGGVVGGLIIGGLLVGYFAVYGLPINVGAMGISGYLIRNIIYTQLTIKDTIILTVLTYIVTLIASLYPAVLAARMEPVEALHGIGD